MLRTLAGGTLFGEVWGSPPPKVVALHGWRRTHADFAAVLGPASAADAPATVAPDLPGFGASPAPAVAWGSENYASAIAALFDGEDGPSSPAGSRSTYPPVRHAVVFARDVVGDLGICAFPRKRGAGNAGR